MSRLLGHQSVTTTERAYAGLADGHLAAAMDLVDAREQLPTVGPSRRTSMKPKVPTKGNEKR